MKKIFTILIAVTALSCKAQTPVLNISEQGYNNVAGAYYKDIDNDLDSFVGHYIYSDTSTGTSFEIMLVKKTMEYNGRYYKDMIIGEYSYVENGILKINTLPALTTIYPDQVKHNIAGSSIIKNNAFWNCTDCTPNEKRFYAGFKENPLTNLYGDIIIKHTVDSFGNPAIKVSIRKNGPATYTAGTTPPPNDFIVKSKEYILKKI